MQKTESENQSSTEANSIPRLVPYYNSFAFKATLTAVMTALVALTTSFLSIPIPATAGFFNVGELMIYIVALLFGPYIGAFAGGVGAALGDVILGYEQYVPGTFIIKGIEGFLIGYFYMKYRKPNKTKFNLILKIIIITIAGSEMVFGYFLYQYFILQKGAAAFIEIPLNYLQGACGLVGALLLESSLEKIPVIQETQNFFLNHSI